MEAEEYESAKSETLKQLEEFHASLSRLMARFAETPTASRGADRPPRAQAGDMTLVDSLGSVQLAIAAAISKAFKTPEARAARRLRLQSQLTAASAQVIKLLALKQPAQLRQRLEQLQARATWRTVAVRLALTTSPAQRDKKLGKITKAAATQQAIEILAALQKLGDEVRRRCLLGALLVCSRVRVAQLAPDEIEFMTKHMTEGIASFQAVTEDGKM